MVSAHFVGFCPNRVRSWRVWSVACEYVDVVHLLIVCRQVSCCGCSSHCRQPGIKWMLTSVRGTQQPRGVVLAQSRCGGLPCESGWLACTGGVAVERPRHGRPGCLGRLVDVCSVRVLSTLACGARLCHLGITPHRPCLFQPSGWYFFTHPSPCFPHQLCWCRHAMLFPGSLAWRLCSSIA